MYVYPEYTCREPTTAGNCLDTRSGVSGIERNNLLTPSFCLGYLDSEQAGCSTS
jgi:hypothetical protein